MAVNTSRKTASTKTDSDASADLQTATVGAEDSNSTSTPSSTTGKRRGGRTGPRGPSLVWTIERQQALVGVIRKIDSGGLPGPLTSTVVMSYLNGTREIPEGMPKLQDRIDSFKDVQELITPAKLNAIRAKVSKVLEDGGKDPLPEFIRTRTTTDPNMFDDLE